MSPFWLVCSDRVFRRYYQFSIRSKGRRSPRRPFLQIPLFAASSSVFTPNSLDGFEDAAQSRIQPSGSYVTPGQMLMGEQI